MIIEDTENAYSVNIMSCFLEDDTHVVEITQEDGVGVEKTIGIDKEQATKIIEVLQKFISGEEID